MTADKLAALCTRLRAPPEIWTIGLHGTINVRTHDLEALTEAADEIERLVALRDK